MKIIIFGIAAYLVYCGFLLVMQRQIIFPAYQATPFGPGLQKVTGGEKIPVKTRFGEVEGWFLTALSGSGKRPVILFAHGNAELIDYWPEFFEFPRQWGMGVFLVEFPGYGRSGGKPSQKSITATFQAAYDLMIKRADVDPDRVVFMGRSLGGGVACALAEKRKPRALVLLSTFTSVRRMAKRFLAPSFLVRDPFDNLSVLEKYSGPVLIVHGRHDDLIPFSHAEALAKAAEDSKLIAYDCGHNDCPPDLKTFFADLKSFFKSSEVLGSRKE